MKADLSVPYDRPVTWQADPTNRFSGRESTWDPTPVAVAYCAHVELPNFSTASVSRSTHEAQARSQRPCFSS